ncbi:MAG: hypothetical protein AM326_03130 [Candidatus Thorarchaeota archaeon SMTZ-45]|nr:MAG: hypothetical protein AM326_03130 [Candidatus Thorarchaeota archaeon SMTZ-45]
MNTSKLALYDSEQCKQCVCTVCDKVCTEKCVHGYENPCNRCELKIAKGEIAPLERKPLLVCVSLNGKGKPIHGIVPDEWTECGVEDGCVVNYKGGREYWCSYANQDEIEEHGDTVTVYCMKLQRKVTVVEG